MADTPAVQKVRLQVILDKDLCDAVTDLAKAEDRSRNQMIQLIVRNYMRDKTADPLARI